MIEDNQMVLTVAQWRDILNLLPDDPDFDELADQIDEAIDGMPFAGEVGILLTDADLAYVGGLVPTVTAREEAG